MSGIWNYDLVSFKVPSASVILPYYGYSCVFAVRAGCGLERHRIHARYFFESFFKFVHEFERALNGLLILIRMYLRKSGEACNPFVQFGVVFHRTRAQRIESRVDRVIQPGEIRVVPYNVSFCNFRELWRVFSGEFGVNLVRLYIYFWRNESPSAFFGYFEYQFHFTSPPQRKASALCLRRYLLPWYRKADRFWKEAFSVCSLFHRTFQGLRALLCCF